MIKVKGANNLKLNNMAKFKFTLIQKLFSTNQEFIIGSKIIEAPNYNKALKIFNGLDVPMHTITTVQKIR